MKKETLDVELAVTHFFKLTDWTNRTLYIGGLMVVVYFISWISQFIFIIPFIGWIIGGFLTLVTCILSIALQIYITGYTIEIADAVKKGKRIADIKVIEYQNKFSEGLKVVAASLLYFIPLFVAIIIIFSFFLFPMIMLGENNDAFSIFAGLGFGLFALGILIILIYELFLYVFILPAGLVNYLKTKEIKAFFEFKEMWRIFKDNINNFLLFFGVMVGLFVVEYFAILFALFSVFFCVGIVLIPVVYAIVTVYSPHVIGHFIGQLAKIDKSNKKK